MIAMNDRDEWLRPIGMIIDGIQMMQFQNSSGKQSLIIR